MNKKINLEDYVTVNERITEFYQKYPNGRIMTDLISWTDGVVIIKATIYREGDEPASTGYAYEVEGSSFINKTSALENCETSAVGRALAFAGFEIKKAIASREEVENAQQKQQQIEKEKNEPIPSELMELYILKMGTDEGMQEAIQKMKEKGFTYEAMIKRLEGTK